MAFGIFCIYCDMFRVVSECVLGITSVFSVSEVSRYNKYAFSVSLMGMAN